MPGNGVCVTYSPVRDPVPSGAGGECGSVLIQLGDDSFPARCDADYFIVATRPWVANF
jgi:hypothetical protein